MERISLRVNNNMGVFVQGRADLYFGGDVSDYVRYLIQKDRESKTPFPQKEAEHWQKRIDTQIADLQAKIQVLTTMKEDVVELGKPIPAKPGQSPP